MKTKNVDIIMQNKVFLWGALATGLILLIPFLLMKFHIQLPDPGSTPSEMNWSLFDFIVMGLLLFGIGSLYVLVARVIPRKYRMILFIAAFIAFLFVWAELAVGLFGTPFAGN